MIALSVLVGCGPVRDQTVDLRDSVHGYLKALRWGHLARAASYIPADQRSRFLERKRLAMAGVQMHEVEVRNVRLSHSKDRARVVVMLVFSRSGDPVVKRHLVEQRWRWDARQWHLVSRQMVQRSQPPAGKAKDLY